MNPIAYLGLFLGIAVVVLLIACYFANNKSLRRLEEDPWTDGEWIDFPRKDDDAKV